MNMNEADEEQPRTSGEEREMDRERERVRSERRMGSQVP